MLTVPPIVIATMHAVSWAALLLLVSARRIGAPQAGMSRAAE
jgi:hypothetical protein